MPFTPFHFGPGLLLKSLAPRHFSWVTFAAAQVVIDFETLYYLTRNEYPVHRMLHTFLGATLAGAATAGVVIGGHALLRRAAPQLTDRLGRQPRWLRSEASRLGIVAGGILGGVSHPLLDGLMHADIRPFLPWTPANPLLGLINANSLYNACIVAGVLGLILLGLRAFLEDRGQPLNDDDAGGSIAPGNGP